MTPVVAVHGGAGSATRAELGEAGAREREEVLRAALESASEVLVRGGAALDAACAAVVVLEDAPCFNAGRGAARTSDGTVELDAAVMEGGSRRAGAVAAVSRVKHPVLGARAVLDDGRHVLLAGPGADAFLDGAGVAAAPAGWFDAPPVVPSSPGTVGAVALDARGSVAAATSTGGLVGQRPGRVGDSPVIGAGTFADDRTCAVSATGDGEVFIRAVFAHTVHVLMAETGMSLQAAVASALLDVRALGGSGGSIAVGVDGAISLSTVTPAMPRGARWLDGRTMTAIDAGE